MADEHESPSGSAGEGHRLLVSALLDARVTQYRRRREKLRLYRMVMRSSVRGWLLAISAGVALGIISQLSNITTPQQMSGGDNGVWAARLFASNLLNTGVLWAGVGVLAGYLVRVLLPALVAGCMTLLVALGVHYWLGTTMGWMDQSAWNENAYWFLAAVVAGGPLGLIGSCARRPDIWGLAARLVVPVGALLEPLYVGRFTFPSIAPWPGRFAMTATGVVLLTGGAVMAVIVLTQWVRSEKLNANNRPRSRSRTTSRYDNS